MYSKATVNTPHKSEPYLKTLKNICEETFSEVKRERGFFGSLGYPSFLMQAIVSRTDWSTTIDNLMEHCQKKTTESENKPNPSDIVAEAILYLSQIESANFIPKLLERLQTEKQRLETAEKAQQAKMQPNDYPATSYTQQRATGSTQLETKRNTTDTQTSLAKNTTKASAPEQQSIKKNQTTASKAPVDKTLDYWGDTPEKPGKRKYDRKKAKKS